MTGKRKVIFVAGSSYSGSTILNLILGNDTRRNALGEIRALYCPKKNHHIKKIHFLRKDPRWKKIIDGKAKNLYKSLFSEFPEIDCFIDSSKDPVWIKYQISVLKKHNIEHEVVLIFKSPKEFSKSALKRNQINWGEKWVSYHLTFFKLIKNYHQISYYDFTTNTEDELKKLFNKLGMVYSKDKKEFWNKNSFNFFGNNHANYQATSQNNELSNRLIDLSYKKDFRKIKNSSLNDEDNTLIVSKGLLKKINRISEKFKNSNIRLDYDFFDLALIFYKQTKFILFNK